MNTATVVLIIFFFFFSNVFDNSYVSHFRRKYSLRRRNSCVFVLCLIFNGDTNNFFFLKDLSLISSCEVNYSKRNKHTMRQFISRSCYFTTENINKILNKILKKIPNCEEITMHINLKCRNSISVSINNT